MDTMEFGVPTARNAHWRLEFETFNSGILFEENWNCVGKNYPNFGIEGS